MKIHTYEGGEERRVLIGLITSKKLLSRLSHVWEKPGHFRSKWANLVAQWCFDHYARYQDAPNRSITHSVASWGTSKGGRVDQDTLRLIERFIASLSDEYSCSEEVNVDVLVDVASRIFKLSRMKRLNDRLQQALEDNDPEAWETARSEYRSLEIGCDGVSDVFQDESSLKAVFEQEDETLFRYGKDLGRFFGGAFSREGFIAFMGPEKRGKSWNLQDVCFKAISQRRKVFMFQAGDMSHKQILRRIAVRQARRPMKPRTVSYPLAIRWEGGDRNKPVVDFEERRFDEPLDLKTAWASFQDVRKRWTRDPKSYFKLHCSPTGTLTVPKIESLCLRQRDEGFDVDAIVIDYADILAPSREYREKRDQVNSIWMELRALSQRLHCLVVTATQANAESYSKITLGMKNFSEDKRKLAHTTGIVGINQTSTEKQNGLMRLNWIVLREEEFHVDRCCYVAPCLPLANPYVRSLM